MPGPAQSKLVGAAWQHRCMPPCVFLSVHTCVVCVYTHARRYPHHLSAKSTTSPQKAPPLMTCTFKNAYYLSNHTTSPSKKPTPLTIHAPPLHHRYHLSRHKVLMNSSYIQWLTLAVIGYSGLVPSPIFAKEKRPGMLPDIFEYCPFISVFSALKILVRYPKGATPHLLRGTHTELAISVHNGNIVDWPSPHCKQHEKEYKPGEHGSWMWLPHTHYAQKPLLWISAKL